ncbi:MAG TPA: TOBE domain-containing protein, partial [Reyranella sp.]
NPLAFLFDEPLSNLDAKLRAQMRIEIKRLHAQLPTTSVFVTHDQVEAMTLGDRVVVMRDGRVQQAGTPLVVYRNPVNKFVAGFIGAPAMNFLDVTIRKEGDTLVAQSPAVKLAVTEPSSRALEAWQGKRVVMGVRPEHLALGDGVLSRSFAARVEVVEQLGSEILLETRVGEARVTVARVAPETQVAAGDQVRLSVQPGRLHFFDPESETTITG